MSSTGTSTGTLTGTLAGSCLCGRVRYEIDGKLGPVVHCHCVRCRKAQGGAFTTGAPVRTKYFHLRSGADAVAEFESSPGKKRFFCRSCGSPLWSRREAYPDVVRVRLGLLADIRLICHGTHDNDAKTSLQVLLCNLFFAKTLLHTTAHT